MPKVVSYAASGMDIDYGLLGAQPGDGSKVAVEIKLEAFHTEHEYHEF